jgi:hypothetical protein
MLCFDRVFELCSSSSSSSRAAVLLELRRTAAFLFFSVFFHHFFVLSFFEKMMMSSSLFFRDDRPTYGTCRRRAVGEIADFLFCFFLHYSLVVFCISSMPVSS